MKRNIFNFFVLVAGIMVASCASSPELPEQRPAGQLPPIISTNTITLQIEGIDPDFRKEGSFPSINALVRVARPDGTPISGLTGSDFFNFADENGVPMGPIVVRELTAGKADIVFIIDSSSSMQEYIDELRYRISNFIAIFNGSSVDWRIGITSFADDLGGAAAGENASSSRPSIAPTRNLGDLLFFLDKLRAHGGKDNLENQIDAIDWARAKPEENTNPAGSYQKIKEFGYREKAKKIFILITDEGFHAPDNPGDVSLCYEKGVCNTLGEEISRLKEEGITVYTASPELEEYRALAEKTGGIWFDIKGNFYSMIDNMAGEISSNCMPFSNYLLVYMTTDMEEGTSRDVRLAVHTASGNAQAKASYVSPKSVPWKMEEK